MILVAFGVAVVAPIVEEITFRGYLFPALTRWRGPWVGAVACGAVFGLAHCAVVAAGLQVVDDPAQLREVGGPEVVGDVAHRLGREQPQHLGADLEEGPAVRLEGADPLGGEQPVRLSSTPLGSRSE